FEEVEGFGDAAGAEVERHHGLGSGLAAPADELVDADFVGLGAVPGEVEAAGAALLGADAVFPAVAGDEVAAGVADGADAQLAGGRDRRCRWRRIGPGARRRCRRCGAAPAPPGTRDRS